jgi:hypothetical protein
MIKVILSSLVDEFWCPWNEVLINYRNIAKRYLQVNYNVVNYCNIFHTE